MRLLLFSSLLLAVSPAAHGAGDHLQIATCTRDGAEYLATIDDRVLLDRRFLDGAQPEADQIHETILHQLRYLWGYYRTRDKSPGAMQIVLGADEPEIRIKSIARTTYGRDLVLDWNETSPRLTITDGYTVRAVKAGAAHAGDEAIAVDYQARFRVAICGEARPADSTLKVMLPADPWLAYWIVPRQERRPMRYMDEPPAVTNPCSDDDFADLPHPFYYWYDWQLDRHGPDDAGHDFDCRALIRPEVDFFSRAIHLARAPSPVPDFAALKNAFSTGTAPLTATVLLGVLDHAWGPLHLDELARALSEPGAPLPERAAALLALPVRRERGAQKLLHLIADFPSVATITGTPGVALDKGYLRVTVEGKLLRSGRALRLRVYLGPTDIFGPSPPEHWGIARQALAGEQIVIYAGHSGLGENLRLSQIEQNLHLSHDALTAELLRAPVQLVAFLSCYSYMYFGRDLMAAAARRPSAGREFVYTGGEYTKGDRGALALLDLVDQVLSPPLAKPALRFVDPEDFLIVKGF